VAELKRRGTTISGDVPGVVREAKLELMAHPPKQAKPLTSDEVQRILSRCQDLEMYAVTEIMWKTASRLTSVTQLMTQDVKETDNNTISMTFRRGKTILASGPYTLWARVSNETLRYIRSQREHGLEQLFQRTAQQLYAPMHKLLQGYQVRSFRRGAVQQMASTDVTLEELRLVTRHVSDQSLYRYLNFGEESLSERRKMLAMTDKL
jgi:integrase